MPPIPICSHGHALPHFDDQAPGRTDLVVGEISGMCGLQMGQGRRGQGGGERGGWGGLGLRRLGFCYWKDLVFGNARHVCTQPHCYMLSSVQALPSQSFLTPLTHHLLLFPGPPGLFSFSPLAASTRLEPRTSVCERLFRPMFHPASFLPRLTTFSCFVSPPCPLLLCVAEMKLLPSSPHPTPRDLNSGPMLFFIHMLGKGEVGEEW